MAERKYRDLSREGKAKYQILESLYGSRFGSLYIRIIDPKDINVQNKAFRELGDLVKDRKKYRCSVRARGAA